MKLQVSAFLRSGCGLVFALGLGWGTAGPGALGVMAASEGPEVAIRSLLGRIRPVDNIVFDPQCGCTERVLKCECPSLKAGFT